MINNLYLLPTPFLYIIIILFSACIGSFINAFVYRLAIAFELIEGPKSINLWWSRSLCPKCANQIAWYDNLPVLSFLFLKGRCRACHQPISWQYPLIEFGTILISLLVYILYGLSLQFLGALCVCWWLIPLALFDLKYFILPDLLTLSLLLLGLVFNYFDTFVVFKQAIIGAIVGYGSLAIIDSLYYLVRKRHGIGQGDWKLLAAFGAWFGWIALVDILFFAALVGAIIGIALMISKKADMQTQLPFGVFLAIAAIVYVMMPQGMMFFGSIMTGL